MPLDQQPITKRMAADDELSTFSLGLSVSNESSRLTGNDTFTVFAFTEEAFEALPEKFQALAQDTSRLEVISYFFKHFIVQGVIQVRQHNTTLGNRLLGAPFWVGRGGS